MNKEQLRKITDWLIINFFRNPDIIYPLTADEMMIEIDENIYVSVVDIVASLHNIIYALIDGERYDYMFHWLNKIGADCADNIFDDFLKEEK